MSRRASILWLTLASALAGSCTVALEYPERVVEGETAASCSNGEDEDLDGRVDCIDPDCDGLCDEIGDRCADGRDNDGDGRSDGLDPPCWTERSVQITRCAQIDGTDLTLPSGATFGWRGTADRVESDGRTWFAAQSAPARIAWATPLTGRTEGSVISIGVHWAGGTNAAVWLVPASSIDTDLTIAPGTDRIGMVLAEGFARLLIRTDIVSYVIDRFSAGAELRLDVALGADDVRTTFSVGTLPAETGRAALPPQWGPDEPLVLLFEADASSEPTLLRDVVVTRPASPRCDRRVPELTAEGENVVLDASVDGVGRTCVLASVETELAETRRMRIYAGEGTGFVDAGVLETPGLVLGASLAWDDARGEWFGLVAGVDDPTTIDPSPEWVRTLRGRDCASLAIGEESGFPRTGLSPGGLDYAILEDGRHRATFDYYGETANRYGLREGFSPDGAPGSWGDFRNLDLGDEYDRARHRSSRLSIDTLGRDRLLFFESEGEVRLHVERVGDWMLLETPVFVAVDEPGTFDRSRISPPRLVMESAIGEDGRWRGRLWYGGASGSGCAGCGRAGSADVEIVP